MYGMANLSERGQPTALDAFFGETDILGKGGRPYPTGALRKALEAPPIAGGSKAFINPLIDIEGQPELAAAVTVPEIEQPNPGEDLAPNGQTAMEHVVFDSQDQSSSLPPKYNRLPPASPLKLAAMQILVAIEQSFPR